MRKLLKHLILSFVLISGPALADGSTVFEHTVKKPMSEVYGKIYKSLEDECLLLKILDKKTSYR